MKPWKEEKNAPATGQLLCQLADLADSEVFELTLAPESKYPFRFFIHKQEGRYRCFMNRCPHFGIPLNMQPRQLFSTDKQQFICSTHYARFNFHDGFCTEGPCEGSSLEVIPIETRNAAIYVAATAGSGH